jgi:signal transduction histidine kinase
VSGKTITLNMNGHGKCIVRANELLHDVFANLVNNAVKHTGDGTEVTVGLDVLEDNGRRFYRVAIEDNGPGIPDDSKKRIFNRMHKGSVRGMGLGLYLVRTLVDSYGGKVWAEDRMSGDHTRGARFVVLLPAIEA